MSDLSQTQEGGEVTLDGPDPAAAVSLEDSVVRLDPNTPADETEVEGEPTADSTPSTWDWSQHADELVTVVVDGEEQQVTVAEAMKGYSRQADYTRKAQQLAQEREELARTRALKEALETDPQRTLATLATFYGIGLPDDQGDYQDPDPTQTAVQQLQAKIEEFEIERQREAVRAEAAAAVKSAKLEATVDDLLVFATENKIGDLNVAARFMAATSKPKETEETKQQKRIAQVVDRGHATRAPGSTAPPPVKTIADAWHAAKKQHGLG